MRESVESNGCCREEACVKFEWNTGSLSVIGRIGGRVGGRPEAGREYV